MKIAAPPARPRRRMNLTPMIDVVFLLLVFFMMVSRFGAERGVPLSLGSASSDGWTGPPRLVDVAAGGVALNGVAMAPAQLIAALTPLMAAPTDPVVLRPQAGSDVQDLLAVIDLLRGAGLARLVVVP